MSSPCSVPDWLRFRLPLETPRQQEGCQRHDERYATGGDHRIRLGTDLVFGLDQLGVDPLLLSLVYEDLCRPAPDGAMQAERAEQYVWGVRMYGGLHWSGGDAPGTLPPEPPPVAEAP